jgi:hypothetical protein
LIFENKIYFFYGNRKIFCYDIEKSYISEICNVPPELPDDDVRRINNEYIDAILNAKYPTGNSGSSSPDTDGQAGQRIYGYVKKQIGF